MVQIARTRYGKYEPFNPYDMKKLLQRWNDYLKRSGLLEKLALYGKASSYAIHR
ncbi:hypothetical protein [Altibacter sp.]|uniref:hypothetical protein n=1 Tax=Altibacter sp. TaxID=2024823 RepID=UPI0025C15BA6|nr:hypothetical protein [Altibacter sp.]